VPPQTSGLHQHVFLDHAGIVERKQVEGDFARLGRIGMRFAPPAGFVEDALQPGDIGRFEQSTVINGFRHGDLLVKT